MFGQYNEQKCVHYDDDARCCCGGEEEDEDEDEALPAWALAARRFHKTSTATILPISAWWHGYIWMSMKCTSRSHLGALDNLIKLTPLRKLQLRYWRTAKRREMIEIKIESALNATRDRDQQWLNRKRINYGAYSCNDNNYCLIWFPPSGLETAKIGKERFLPPHPLFFLCWWDTGR